MALINREFAPSHKLPWNKAVVIQLAKPITFGAWKGWLRVEGGVEVNVQITPVDGEVLRLLTPGCIILVQISGGALVDWTVAPLPAPPCLPGDEWKNA